MEGMKTFAASTPFEFPEIAASAQGLLAMGIAGEDALNVIEAAGDAASSMNKGAAGMQTITSALGKVQSQGKLTTDDMNTLAEQGGFSWENLADKMGVSVDQVREDVTSGAISSTEAINAFMSSTFEDVGGMMDKQSRTLIGLWSTFKDTVGQLLGDTMAPLTEALKKGLPEATKFFETLRPSFESLAASLGTVIDFVSRVAAGFNAMTPEAQQAAIQFFEVAAGVTVAVAAVGALLSTEIGVFLLAGAAAAAVFAGAFVVVLAAVVAVGKGIRTIVTAIDVVMAALDVMVAIAKNKVLDFLKPWLLAADVIALAFDVVADKVTTTISDAVADMGRMVTSIADKIRDVPLLSLAAGLSGAGCLASLSVPDSQEQAGKPPSSTPLQRPCRPRCKGSSTTKGSGPT
jgi:tape measure domain-containing protein